MDFTDFEKTIIKSIATKEIDSVLDYPSKFFEYNVEKNTWSNFSGGDLYYFKSGIDVLLVSDYDKAFIELQKFMALLSKLEGLGLISVVEVPSNEIPPVFSFRYKDGKNPSPDRKILLTLSNYKNKTFIPNSELSDFVDNGYKTSEEIEKEELLIEKEEQRQWEILSRKKAQKETHRLAYFTIGVSIFMAISTSIFNYLTYTNERVVIIKNPIDTANVRIINGESLELLKNGKELANKTDLKSFIGYFEDYEIGDYYHALFREEDSTIVSFWLKSDLEYQAILDRNKGKKILVTYFSTTEFIPEANDTIDIDVINSVKLLTK